MSPARYALIGFGEVGGLFARDLIATGAAPVAAYDSAEAARARTAACTGAAAHASAAAACAGADVVFVAVTAASVLDAVRSLEGGLAHAPFVVDVNSVSPATKREGARIVEAAGGRYVEAAVMASVPPKGLRSPILLGGPHAGAFAARVAPLGMDLTVFSAEIGAASSVKMCRSVMIKGLEALTTECLLAARHYGVTGPVLASLSDTFPGQDWTRLAGYLIDRSLKHGQRRAEEMREVARTVREAGVDPSMSLSTAARQDWAHARGRLAEAELATAGGLDAVLDAIASAGRTDHRSGESR